MRKRLFLLLSVIALIYISSIISAADLKTCEPENNDCKIDNAYICINNQIGDCSSLASSEAKIFSLLATGKCGDKVISDSKYKSDLKYTAQAILGLKDAGMDTKGAEEWLISQNTTPTQLSWYLQIDAIGASRCTAEYLSTSNVIDIGEDKKINSITGPGSCLTISSNGYWLQVNNKCYGDEFSVSCDQSFSTNLLYKKTGSDTIYVSPVTNSESAGQPAIEKVESLCFRQGASCSYEGSLWSALVLDSLDYDMSAYKSYLVTLAEDNLKYLPESFLSLLIQGGNYQTELLAKQKNKKYWQESDDRYYDTAVAVYPLRFDEILEKQNTVNWLLNEAQGKDGCWNNGNLRDTSFLLYSLWPRTISSAAGAEDIATVDCEDAGNYCMSSLSCGEVGQVLEGYSCSGTFVCCSEPKTVPTCEEQEGDICNSNQNCVGGSTVSASDLDSGQVCCYQGSCEISTASGTSEASECEISGGRCDISCDAGEEESYQICGYSTDVCCLPKSTDKNISQLWIWILVALIAIIIIAIIFRDGLRVLLLKIQSGFGEDRASTSRSGPRGGFPPSSMHLERRPIPSRRIIPSQPPHHLPQRPKPAREVDDVLKKLKEMGK